MALRLARNAFAASRMNVARSILPVRGGGGGPLPPAVPPTEPLPDEDELIWDDGTGNPEFCLDWLDNTGGMTPGIALSMVIGTFGAMYAMGKFIAWTDPEGRRPYADKQFVFDENKHFYPARNQA